MQDVQKLAAQIALFFVTVILGSAVVASWIRSAAAADLLVLTQLVLSWPVAAAGLVFGGGQAIIRAWKQ